jgi:ubiquinone/menaquinone biosynthesis C-methylase UbiE
MACHSLDGMATSRPDPVRASSFGAVADDYDEFRPRPPAGLADSLGTVDGADAVDVAAGTGLLTRFLADHGARVTAVEPDTRMAEVLASRSPGVRVVTGTAEALPLPDGSADLVTVSSAWHWFDHDRAAAEFARVLRPGGRLVVLWNGVDYGSADWLAQLRQQVGARGAGDPSRRAVDLPADLPFGPTTSEYHRWTWNRTVDEIAGLLGTYSGVLIDDPSLRDSLTDEVRAAALERLEDGQVVLPMVCRTVWTVRT